MKKKLILMPLLTLILSSCVMYNGQGKPGTKSSTPTPSSVPEAQSSVSPIDTSIEPPSPPSHEDKEELPEGTAVKVYLVFGEYGLYKGNPVNSKVESLFLEHTLEQDFKVGDALPGEADVTSTVEGSKFVAWVAYNYDGKLTEYAKAPAINGKILYASFSNGKGGERPSEGGEVTPPTPATYEPATEGALPTEGFGFKFSDGKYMKGFHTDDFDGFKQYLISARSFQKDQVFQLYDFANSGGWVVDIDPYSFGDSTGSGNEWKKYLNKGADSYTVLQDFNVVSVYIKIKNNADQVFFELVK